MTVYDFSVVSAGGTRTVRRRRKKADGTYGTDEEYHSDDSANMMKAAKKHKDREKAKKKAKGRRVHGSDSEYKYVCTITVRK